MKKVLIGLVAYKYWFENYFTLPPMLGLKSGSYWKYWATMKLFIKDDKIKIVDQDLDLKYEWILYSRHPNFQKRYG